MHSTHNLVAINKNLSNVNTICISNSIRFYRQWVIEQQQQNLLLLNIYGYSRLSFGLMIDLLAFHEPSYNWNATQFIECCSFCFLLVAFVVEFCCRGRMVHQDHPLLTNTKKYASRANITLNCVRILNQGQIQVTNDFGNLFDFVYSFYFSWYFAAYFSLCLCCKLFL